MREDSNRGYHLGAITFGVLMLAAAGSRSAAAQVQQALDGDCTVIVQLPTGVTISQVSLLLNAHPLVPQFGQVSPAAVIVVFKQPLSTGDTLDALVAGAPLPPTMTVTARATGTAPPSACGSASATANSRVLPEWEGREAFVASGYLGYAYDNFSPSNLGNYRNPEDAGDIRSRWIGGLEAEYRFPPFGRGIQLWFGGKTLHGVRTADVNCGETPELTVCQDDATFRERLLYILANASTLEGHFTPRLEFLTIAGASDFPVRVYLGGHLSFLAVQDASKLAHNQSIELGATLSKGPFARSLVEVGVGRSELFQENKAKWNRLRINGLLVFDVFPGLEPSGLFNRMGRATRMFAQILIDQNRNGSAPDSVQTLVGVDFDLRKAFTGFLGR